MTYPVTDSATLALSVASAGLRAPNQGMSILIGYTLGFAGDLVREYSSLPGMVADGMDVNSPLYKMAGALQSQSPSPTSWKVGRRTTPTVQAITLTVLTDVADSQITVSLVSPDTGIRRDYTRSAVGGGIPAEATALALLMNNDPTGFGTLGTNELTFTANVNDVECTFDGAGGTAGQIFYYYGLRNLDLDDVTADPGIAADIALMQLEDDDWYGYAIDSTSSAEQEAAAAMAGITGKTALGFLSTQDSAVRNDTAGNICKVVDAADRNVTTFWSPHSMEEYPGVAAMGTMLARNPGGTTLAYQQLSGVTPAGTNDWDLSEAQLAIIRADRGNTYGLMGTTGMVDPTGGWMANTYFVDTQLTLDYISLNIPVEVANALAATARAGKKVAYKDPDAPKVARAAIYAALTPPSTWGAIVLRDSEADGGTNYFTFTALAAASQTAGNKAARNFAGVTFSCLLTGAVQSYALEGVLSFA